jgi:hypothetical protein
MGSVISEMIGGRWKVAKVDEVVVERGNCCALSLLCFSMQDRKQNKAQRSWFG